MTITSEQPFPNFRVVLNGDTKQHMVQECNVVGGPISTVHTCETFEQGVEFVKGKKIEIQNRAIVEFLLWAQQHSDIFDPVMIEAGGKIEDDEITAELVKNWQEQR